jgi:NarL family two-component system response regulator LiaR
MIKVLVADDHYLVREGLSHILDTQQDMTCIGVAEDGIKALEKIKELKPDVAIIDVEMPGLDGIETTRHIKNEYPKVAVLVLSAYDYEDYVLACVQAGADGYVLKSHMPGEGILDAIRMVHRGSTVLDHYAINLLLKAASRKQTKICGELGPREIEVLELAAKGMTNKEIGAQLCISDQTVGTHFVNIFRKLQVRSRVEAVLFAIDKGWISGRRHDS